MAHTLRQVPSLPLGLTRGDVLTAVATGLLSLPDPARRSAAGRFALRTAAAGYVAVGMWASTRKDERAQLDATARVGLTAGVVGLTYGAAELGEALDRALQRRLAGMGVRRPRVAMALAGAGLALAMSVLERRADDAEDDDAELVDEPVVRELPADVRELVSALLEQTEDHDSLRLRAQLAAAREVRWDDEPASGFVDLVVPDDVPLAVPHTFTFPVSARFTSARGVPCRAQLLVEGGRLSALVVDVDDEAWEPLAADWDADEGDANPLAGVALPSVRDVTFVTEGRG